MVRDRGKDIGEVQLGDAAKWRKERENLPPGDTTTHDILAFTSDEQLVAFGRINDEDIAKVCTMDGWLLNMTNDYVVMT